MAASSPCLRRGRRHLIHLAEKFGAFLPTEPAARAECLSWLMWQMGSAPYLGGGFGHFYAYAPTKIEYAIDRFAMEVKRQMDVLDRRLAENEYLGGTQYTIADMAVWPWYGALAKGLIYEAGEFLQVADYKNVQRWTDAIAERPAVKRGRMVNRIYGDPASQLRERHEASDFDTKTQDKVAGGGVRGGGLRGGHAHIVGATGWVVPKTAASAIEVHAAAAPSTKKRPSCCTGGKTPRYGRAGDHRVANISL